MDSTSTVDDVCTKLQVYMLTLSGIRDAQQYPPENPLSGLVSICYPSSGTWSKQSDWKRGLHEITLELSVPRKDLPRDIAALLPFVESVPNLLFSKLTDDNQWNNLIDTFGSIDYAFAAEEYAGVTRLFLRFTIHQVKMQTAIS